MNGFDVVLHWALPFFAVLIAAVAIFWAVRYAFSRDPCANLI